MIGAECSPSWGVEQPTAIYASNNTLTDEFVAHLSGPKPIVKNVFGRVFVTLLYPLRNGNRVVGHLVKLRMIVQPSAR